MILLIATNAGLIGVSRLTYSMGQHRQLPEVLRQVHPRYRTPYIAIMIFAAIAIVTLLRARPIPGDALLVRRDALVHHRPRRGDPAAPPTDRRRAHLEAAVTFRAFGFEVPLTAVLGGLGTFGALIVVMASNPRTLFVGVGWMSFGTSSTCLPAHQELPLTKTVKVVLPEPLGVEEVEYQSILVGFEDDESFSPRWSRPPSSPPSAVARSTSLDADGSHQPAVTPKCPIRSRGAKADRGGETDRRPARHRPIARVRPGQAGHRRRGGKAIRAEAIVVGLRRRGGVPLYDKTLQTVLGERPCRVIVVSDPSDSRRGPTKRWSRWPVSRERGGGEPSTAGGPRIFAGVRGVRPGRPRRHPR